LTEGEQRLTVDSILDTIGHTPMVRMRRMLPASGCSILGKLEALNPAGSVKDRVGISMIRSAERLGALKPGMVIVEPTSGNTGIALAMAAAALGYELVLTMPDSMSAERISVMAAYGARIILTPGIDDMAGAISQAQRIKDADPAGTYMPQQFRNSSNPQVHRETTACEILHATGGRIDAFVAGVGTGGTISGVGEVLKQKSPGIRIVAVEPARSPVLSGGEPGLHGIQGIGAGFVPEVLETDVIDEIVQVEDEEAFECTRRLAREEGLLLGPSSGANMAASLRIGESLAAAACLVTVLCDTGFRYFSVDGMASS